MNVQHPTSNIEPGIVGGRRGRTDEATAERPTPQSGAGIEHSTSNVEPAAGGRPGGVKKLLLILRECENVRTRIGWIFWYCAT